MPPPLKPTIPFRLEAAIAAVVSFFCIVSLLADRREDSWAGSPQSSDDLALRLHSQPREILEREVAAQITYVEELQALYEKAKAAGKALTDESTYQGYQKDIERAKKERDAEVKRRNELARGKDNIERDMASLLQELEASLYQDSLVMHNFLEANRTQLEAAWKAGLSKLRPQGIVMSAGGEGPLTNAFVTLYVLRHHHKCTLPIAVMYWGAYVGDNIDDATKELFKEHIPDIEFIDASRVPSPPYQRSISPLGPDGTFGRQSGWIVKAYTLYAAPFQEVLSLDTDSLPLLDPACLFKEETYLEQGNLFWADYYNRDVSVFSAKRMYDVLRLENPWADNQRERQTEAGQFMFNRAMHRDVLEWLHFLTARAELVYRIAWGDKDTYRVAFQLARKAKSYALVSQYPAILIKNKLLKGMLQLHPNGTAMFNHHTLRKYSLHQRGPLGSIQYITPRLPGDLAMHIVFRGPWKEQVITPANCSYSFWDMPADQHRCAPNYDEEKRGLDQDVPLFEYTQDTHVAKAEAAGYEAFKVLQQAKKLG